MSTYYGDAYNAGSGYAASPVDAVRDVRSMASEQAVAVVAGGALILLFLIRRGFRGVNVGGVGVSIK